MKIVINKSVGGFCLSVKALDRILELGGNLSPSPLEEWEEIEGCDENNVLVKGSMAYTGYDPIPRNDPALIQTIEELGLDAGRRAYLIVVEIPTDVAWHIFECDDGTEYVAENHRTWS